MFENFILKNEDVLVTGYRWNCDSPSHVVCLVHGIGEYAGRYNRIAEYFRKNHIAVLAMDLRGHGLSGGIRGDAAPRAEILSDIDSLLERARQLYPKLPIVLYGHSMGGNIVMNYRHCGRLSDMPAAYIVSAPWIKLCRNFSNRTVSLVRALSRAMPTFQMSSRVDEKILGNEKYVYPYKTNILIHNRITLRCAIDGFDTGCALFDGRLCGNEGGADKPLLLMHGDMDKICSVEGSRRLAENERNCTYAEWPGHCHEIHNGGPRDSGEKVIFRAVEFIKNQEGAL